MKKIKFTSDDNHIIYYNESGDQVPSATTILKILNKPQLVKWANHLGFNHLHVDSVLRESSELGSLIHDLINSMLLKQLIVYVPDRYISSDLVFSYMNRFKIWFNTNNIEPMLLEKSLICDTFGGTVDFYGKINDKYTILDFKTSKKIRINMFFQLALYTILLENSGYKVDQVGILLVNPKFQDEKYIQREDLNKYVDFVKGLIEIFYSYYDININDKWYEIII